MTNEEICNVVCEYGETVLKTMPFGEAIRCIILMAIKVTRKDDAQAEMK